VGGLIDPSEDVAGVDGLAFFGLDALDLAFFRRANFVLHFHGFDNNETLARFDFVADLHEETDDFAGHGSDDLLAAFGFEGALFSATPGARIADIGLEFMWAGLEFIGAIERWRDVNFEGGAIQEYRDGVGRGQNYVGINGLAVERDSAGRAILFQINNVLSLSSDRVEMDFKFHGWRSSCVRRPSCFQREGADEVWLPTEELLG
jgi:hypothetical protein